MEEEKKDQEIKPGNRLTEEEAEEKIKELCDIMDDIIEMRRKRNILLLISVLSFLFIGITSYVLYTNVPAFAKATNEIFADLCALPGHLINGKITEKDQKMLLELGVMYIILLIPHAIRWHFEHRKNREEE